MTHPGAGLETTRLPGRSSRRGPLVLLVTALVGAIAALELARRRQSAPRVALENGREPPAGETVARLLDELAQAAPGIDSSRLRLELRDGVAVLRGEVDWPEQRLCAQRWLAGRDGVLDVVNLLTLSGSAAPRFSP